MTLYHGTNADIESIDLAKGIRYKDFGQGFYLTPDRWTATEKAYTPPNRQRNCFRTNISTSSISSGQNVLCPFSTKPKS